MKRHGDEGGMVGAYPGMKRQKADGYAEALAAGKFELRLLIASRAAGAVIGKGGENIKRLRQTLDATISVPDSSTPERVMTIVAEVDKCLEIVKELLPKLEDGSSRGTGDDYRQNNNGAGEKNELRMLVHQSHAGALIGRSGSKIKELREKTNASLKVFTHCAPQSTDRVVLIGGSEQQVVDCVAAVIETMRDIGIKGPAKPYETINYDPSFAPDYGGFLPDRNSWRPPGQGAAPGGPGMGRGGAPGMGMPPGGPYGMGGPPRPGGPPRGPGGPPGGPRMPGMGGPGMGPPFGYPGAAVQTTQVTIPSELGGTIIGRGGERINRIREDSGAHIVLEPSNGEPERVITISGTETQIQTAQYLLQQCVRTSIAGRKYVQQH